MNKADRQRRLARDRKRRYRARKAESASQERALAELDEYIPVPTAPPEPPKPCVTCGRPSSFDHAGTRYCWEHGKDASNKQPEPAAPAATIWPAAEAAVSLPPTPPPFDPSQDRFRPAFWDAIDPKPAPLEIGLSPRAPRRSPPITSAGFTDEEEHGFVFSHATGHVNVRARQAELEERRKDTGR